MWVDVKNGEGGEERDGERTRRGCQKDCALNDATRGMSNGSCHIRCMATENDSRHGSR